MARGEGARASFLLPAGALPPEKPHPQTVSAIEGWAWWAHKAAFPSVIITGVAAHTRRGGAARRVGPHDASVFRQLWLFGELTTWLTVG